MAMTLEEAIKNARGYEEQYEREKTLWEMSPPNGTDRSKHFRLMKEAKVMLEEYNGYYKVRGHYKRNADGTVVTECNEKGEPVGVWVEDSKEWVDGKIAQLANEAQRLQERSNLGKRFLDRTFANFEKRRDENAYKACMTYSNTEDLFSKQKNSLMIYGKPGTGKTHLAAAIANDFVSKGIPTLFGTYIEHLDHIRDEFDHGGTNDYLAEMKNVPVLVIDDFGQEKATDWTRQILYQIVNYRYEHLLPIIVTTNFSASELANDVGNSVYSRLYEMSSGVETHGKDYRMER